MPHLAERIPDFTGLGNEQSGDWTNLTRGADYEFVEGEAGSPLAIFIGGVERPLGNFALFKRTNNPNFQRLFLNDLNHNFYQNKIDDLRALVRYYVKRNRCSKTLYWGNSAGGYLAALLGATDPVAKFVYAFSPQFNLYHRHTFGFRHARQPEERFARIFDLVSTTKVRMFLFLPVYEPDDGITVQESLAISNPNVVSIYLRFQHSTEFFLNLNGVLDPIIQDFFGEKRPRVPQAFVATDLEIGLATLSYHLNVELRDERLPALPAVDDSGCQNPAWWQIKSRIYVKMLQPREGIAAAMTSLQCQPGYEPALIDLGDAFAQCEQWFLAAAAYRQCIRVNAEHSYKWLRLAEMQIKNWELDDAELTLDEVLRRQPYDKDRHRELTNWLASVRKSLDGQVSESNKD